MICKECLYFDPEDAETAVCVRVDKRRLADDSPLTEECFEEILIPIDEYIGKFYSDEDAFFKVAKLSSFNNAEIEMVWNKFNGEIWKGALLMACKDLVCSIKTRWKPVLDPKEVLKMFPQKEIGAKPTLQEFVEDHFEKAAFDVREKLRKENGNV